MANWLSTLPVPIREVKGSRREEFNNISGNPSISVQLQTAWSHARTAKCLLLGGEAAFGGPAIFPDYNFITFYCSSVDIVSDGGLYTSADDNILTPSGNALLNVRYMARMGSYRLSYTSGTVYVEDLAQPRPESIPVNPNHLVWNVYDPQTPNTISPEKPTLQAGEAPNIPDNGLTLIHTLEGYHGAILQLNDDLIGTTNAIPYISAQLRFTFPIGTLMLRNYELTKNFSFQSYKLASTIPVGGFDPMGKMTYTIKMFYEYKKIGWNVFRRADMRVQEFTDLYKIRYAESPYGEFEAFPQSPYHNHFLAFF